MFQHFMVMFHDRDDTLSTLSTINCILHVLLRYFHLTNFFWMFVEGTSSTLALSNLNWTGLYLFLQVQASFSVGSLKLRHCAFIGWGEYGAGSCRAGALTLLVLQEFLFYSHSSGLCLYTARHRLRWSPWIASRAARSGSRSIRVYLVVPSWQRPRLRIRAWNCLPTLCLSALSWSATLSSLSGLWG